MSLTRTLLLGMLVLTLPLAAWADVIPISDVNADNASGDPLLYTQVVTVRGVVTVGTGKLAEGNEIYIQDATGGVCVVQSPSAAPSVAPGDSVEVTGKVDVIYFKRTYLKVDASTVPGSSIRKLSTGNAVPEPMELTPDDLATAGEDYEGIYAVMRGVSLVSPGSWPTGDCTGYVELGITDGASGWMWVNPFTDVCGSPPPSDVFDVYGVVAPDPKQPNSGGYGIIPPSREDVRSLGSGTGYASVEPDWVFAGDDVDLTFVLEGEGDVVTTVEIAVPAEWGGFSGVPGDVTLDGPGFFGAHVDQANTDAYLVTVVDASLEFGVEGELTIDGLSVPGTAGDHTFVVRTAIEGGALVEISESPVVHTATTGEPGDVLINEIYANTMKSFDSAEFIELYNPGGAPVDISGWVLTDITDAGECGGTDLWEFPSGTEIGADDYIVVAKDARWTSSIGFYAEFFEYPDFEMYDSDYVDIDNATTPNMILVTPADGSSSTSQEIQLYGGSYETAARKYGARVYEAVYLFTDRLRTELVDAVEYRNAIYLDEDYCQTEGLGGDDDAFIPGAPPQGYTLSRDDSSTDTDSSRDDFHLTSTPTPGAVNVIEDDAPPTLVSVMAAGNVFVKLSFSEPLDPDEAVSVSNYSVSDGLNVNDAWLARDGRTVLINTDAQTASQSYVLTVDGVTDAAGNALTPTDISFTGYYRAPTPISEIQAWDEDGLSPLLGQEVNLLAFTTVPPGVFQKDRTNMFVEDLDRYGVNVYTSSLLAAPPMEGDLVEVTGAVVEYVSDGNGASTEVTSSGGVSLTLTVLARGFNVLEPRVMETGDVGREENEGTLITTSGVVTTLAGFAFYIDDGSGQIQVYQNFSELDFSKYSVGDSVRVTGVMLQYDYTAPYFGGYELAPRYSSDLEILEAHYSEDASISVTAKVLDIDTEEVVEIAFNGPRGSQTAVRIFDLKGREIATVYSGFCLGPQRATWDGRTDDGSRAPAGVYICHVYAKDQVDGEITSSAAPIVLGMKLD